MKSDEILYDSKKFADLIFNEFKDKPIGSITRDNIQILFESVCIIKKNYRKRSQWRSNFTPFDI